MMIKSPLTYSPSLSVLQAQQQIQNAIVPITDFEQIACNGALDRICAENIIAPINVPGFDNSAMDGYAYCSDDLASTKQFDIVGTAFAGHPYTLALRPGEAIQITTGARIPARCDTVLPQELAVLMHNSVLDLTHVNAQPGQHVRRCGEDLALGSIAITKGSRLGPAELGLLASLGIFTVPVRRRLQVALFSNGDELRSSLSDSQQLDDSSIYDSNRATLRAMLTRFGAEVVDLGVLDDDPQKLTNALKKIAPQVDVIITSGGMANSAADYTRQAIQELGDMSLLSINMRPGRTMAFGKLFEKFRAQHSNKKNTYFFGLPGNPVAAMINFYFFVRPALQILNGAQVSMPLPVNAMATYPIPKKIGRTEFQRGICQLSEHGQLHVCLTGAQGSGVLSSMSYANCIVILDGAQGDVEPGDIVQIMLFDSLALP